MPHINDLKRDAIASTGISRAHINQMIIADFLNQGGVTGRQFNDVTVSYLVSKARNRDFNTGSWEDAIDNTVGVSERALNDLLFAAYFQLLNP